MPFRVLTKRRLSPEFRRALGYLVPYRRRLLLVVLLSALNTALSLTLPYLSKTLVDVENLSARLAETTDWNAGLQRYAAEHNDYYGKLHNILSWMTELVWSGGPAADERRSRVFPRLQADPTGFPDPTGQGPFGPCDEQARRLILGET